MKLVQRTVYTRALLHTYAIGKTCTQRNGAFAFYRIGRERVSISTATCQLSRNNGRKVGFIVQHEYWHGFGRCA